MCSAVRSEFPLLSSEFTIRGRRIRNRIAMAPILMGGAQDHLAGPGHVEHYGRIADGGTGLIVVEVAAVCAEGLTHPGQIGLWSEGGARALAPVAERIHAAGAVCLVQLSHGGPRSPSVITGMQPLAASAMDLIAPESARRASMAEIESIVERFVDAGELAAAAGALGVEIHAAHLYFISTFLSRFTNRRRDRYGGKLSHRAGVLLEVVRGIRSRCGDDFIISVRLNGVELLPRGLTVEESAEVARMAGQAGADLIHVSAYAAPVATSHNNRLTVGSTPGRESLPGMFLPYAKAVRERCGRPVIGVGRILEPDMAERALCSGQADFIALGRALLRDPDWPNKALHGRVQDIERCVTCQSCHQAQGKSFVLCSMRSGKPATDGQ